MTKYSLMYRFGIRPWKRYGAAAVASIAAPLDREESERPRRLGRALDLGCGHEQYTPGIARRGWQAVGVDLVPAAIEAARRRDADGATYSVGDVTDLLTADLGTSTSASTLAASTVWMPASDGPLLARSYGDGS